MLDQPDTPPSIKARTSRRKSIVGVDDTRNGGIGLATRELSPKSTGYRAAFRKKDEVESVTDTLQQVSYFNPKVISAWIAGPRVPRFPRSASVSLSLSVITRAFSETIELAIVRLISKFGRHRRPDHHQQPYLLPAMARLGLSRLAGLARATAYSAALALRRRPHTFARRGMATTFPPAA